MAWSKDGENSQSLKLRPPERNPRVKISKSRVIAGSVHSLIREGREHFDSARARDDDPYLKPSKKLLVDVTCSRDCLDKALSLANNLFNAFESRGYRVVLAPANERLGRDSIDERESGTKERPHGRYPSLWSPHRPTVVYIGTVAFGLAVIEMSEEVLLRYVSGKYIRESDYTPPKASRYAVDHTWTTTRDLPSGRLRLIAYCPYRGVTWSTLLQETKKFALDGRILEFVRTIEKSASEVVGRIEEAERRAELERQHWREEHERYLREDDQRQIDKSIRDSQDHLRQIIQRWSDVIGVERFLEGVKARSAELPADERDQILSRLKLARDFLGNVDPLKHFLNWKTPVERYEPRYTSDSSPDA